MTGSSVLLQDIPRGAQNLFPAQGLGLFPTLGPGCGGQVVASYQGTKNVLEPTEPSLRPRTPESLLLNL